MQGTCEDQLQFTGDSVGIVGRLHDAYALGRSSWPEIVLSYESFRLHAARHGYSLWSVPAHPVDLYLCAACISGSAAAYEALEARFFSKLRPVVGRIVGEDLLAEEVLQDVRTRLFVGRAPKITSYRGNGPLAGWLRSLAVNVAQDCLRSKVVQRGRLRKVVMAQREEPIMTEMDESEEPFALRGECAEVCCRAWCEAIRALCGEERELLRQCFVFERSVDELGTLYGVHRATIHRRIRRAVERLRLQVSEVLSIHYGDLTAADRDEMAFSAGCQLNLSAILLDGEVNSSRAASSAFAAGGWGYSAGHSLVS
jgi:RNA polymerase sigma-70 factor, ECF subfamily